MPSYLLSTTVNYAIALGQDVDKPLPRSTVYAEFGPRCGWLTPELPS
jgi:hypothetical protein